MAITISERIRVLMLRRNKTIGALASDIKLSRQSLNTKFRNDNFTLKELKAIAAALDCDFEEAFIMKDTGERI